MISKFFRLDAERPEKQELTPDCQKSLQELSLTDNITSVEIPQYRVRGSFVEYVIECTKRNVTWHVFRRYQQFKTLDQKLKQLCSMGSPQHSEYGVIPVLCGSHWTEVTNQSVDLVEKRRRYLEIYLRQLLVPGNVFYVANTAVYDFLHDGAVPAQYQRNIIRPLIGFSTPDSLSEQRISNWDGEASTGKAVATAPAHKELEAALLTVASAEDLGIGHDIHLKKAEISKGDDVDNGGLPLGEYTEPGEDVEDAPSAEDATESDDVRVPPALSLCPQCSAEFSSVLYPHRCFFCTQRFCRNCLQRVDLEEGEVAKICPRCHENYTRRERRSQGPTTPVGVLSGALTREAAEANMEALDLLSYVPHIRTDVTLSDFQLVTTVGRGTFGKVMKVIFRENGKVYAMKVLNKCAIHRRRMIEYVKEEKNIMSLLPPHPYIVTCHFSFQTDHHLFFVLDYLPGGDMHSRVYPKCALSPSDVRVYAAELVLALQHLHRHDVAHRDVKLENIVLGEDGHLRLTDFGLARMNFSRRRRRSFVGSPEYLPPETIRGKYQTKAVDWWSTGVLLYEMLSGRTPFYSSVNSEIYDNVLKAELDFSDPCFTPEAAALIGRLLQSHPSQRLDDAEAIKAHPYFASVDWAALEAKKVPAPIQLDLTMSDVRYIKWKFTSEWATIPKPSDVTRDTVDMLISRFSNFAHVSDEAPPTSASGQAANGEEQREQDDAVATTTTPRGSRDVVGLWSIASVEMRTIDGKVVYPWGSKVRGVLAYFPDGQVSLQIAAQMRPCLRHHLAERATREELIEVCNSYMACFGTYETDAGANTIAHRLHGSLGPNLTNSTQKYTYKLEGSDKHGVEKLKLYSSFNELPGEHMAAQTILTWKRVSTF